MATETFYQELPTLDDFIGVADEKRFTVLPDDWLVAVADVESSTAAIQHGRYKEVNLLGASCIIAVINAVRPVRIPFVFGGDGATLAFPPTRGPIARDALAATCAMARDQFNLTLRCGIVEARALRSAGHPVLVARIRTQGEALQAAFAGGGTRHLERQLKQRSLDASAVIDPSAHRDNDADRATNTAGDFTGLECRWNDIPNRHGKYVAVLVRALSGDPTTRGAVYRDVIKMIGRTFENEGRLNPMLEPDLTLTQDAKLLQPGAKVHAWRKRMMPTWMMRWGHHAANMSGRIVMRLGVRAAGVNWGNYKRDVIANTDYRKFDDALRGLLSGNETQIDTLRRELEHRHARGELVFGLHTSDSALMTCLIIDRAADDHIHFVDGAQGGYAMAAAEMKRQEAAL